MTSMIKKTCNFFLVSILTMGLVSYVQLYFLPVKHYEAVFNAQTEFVVKDSLNSDWQEIITAKDLWEAHPEIIRSVFSSLDLEHPGLKPVLEALQNADTVSAANRLVTYYKNSDSGHWLREKSYRFGNSEERNRAEQLLNDKITRNGFAEIPKKDNGGWDWTYHGPRDDAEFGYTLNRHRYFIDLLKGWQETGEETYAEKFDLLVRDWSLHNPLPGEDHRIWEVLRTSTDELDWRDINEVVWRVLEAGNRMGDSWPQAFYGFQDAEEFSAASRLLMLSGIPVHAQYLMEHHAIGHNHGTMELNGLGLAGLAFPEFRQADQWVDYALDKMEDELEIQVYPDGVQTELTSSYQLVALSHFETLIENYRNAGLSVSDSYLNRVEEMYNYLAYSMRPDGFQPLNNDSDRRDMRPAVISAAEIFDRPDWRYIATNGEEGVKPDGLPSRVFPWAGIHVMRNGWDSDNHWGFFHTGPYGTGHQHRDLLHLSVHAYGRDLLVDTGRYTYEDYFNFDPANWRGYFRSSFSHNVVLVDGAGQNVWERIAEDPLKEGTDYVNTEEFDYARDTFTGGYENTEGEAEHTRAVLYVRGKYWVIVDRITTDMPRKLEALWNFAPDVNTVIEDFQVVSNDTSRGNLRIVPAGKISWDVEITKGQTEPYKRGWYSATYGNKEPIPTAVYTADIESDTTFAWVLVPANGTVSSVQADLINPDAGKVRVQIEGEESLVVTVPVTDGTPEIDD